MLLNTQWVLRDYRYKETLFQFWAFSPVEIYVYNSEDKNIRVIGKFTNIKPRKRVTPCTRML